MRWCTVSGPATARNRVRVLRAALPVCAVNAGLMTPGPNEPEQRTVAAIDDLDDPQCDESADGLRHCVDPDSDALPLEPPLRDAGQRVHRVRVLGQIAEDL